MSAFNHNNSSNNYNIHLLNTSNANATLNPGGYDLEKMKDGTVHSELKDRLTCGICLEILVSPMECDNCRGLFCQKCISRWGKNCPF
jgi:hypothetical protein